MKKGIPNSYFTCLLISVLLLSLGLAVGKLNIYQGIGDKQTVEIFPTAEETISEDDMAYYFQLEDVTSGDVVEFFTHHQEA